MEELRCDERPGYFPGKPFEPLWSFAPWPFWVVAFSLGASNADNGARRGAGYEGESLERIPAAAWWLNGMEELRCDERRVQASGNPLNPYGASLGRPVSRGDAYSFAEPLWAPGRGDVPDVLYWVSLAVCCAGTVFKRGHSTGSDQRGSVSAGDSLWLGRALEVPHAGGGSGGGMVVERHGGASLR